MENANIFVDWRYAFEKSASASVDLFIAFSKVIQFYAINIFQPGYIENNFKY